MQIGKPEIERSGGEVTYRVHVHSAAGDDTLWYRLPERYADFVVDNCDAPLVALLIPAMALGEDIHLAGGMSERLFYSLSRPYQRLVQHVIPSLRRVAIHPGELRRAVRGGAAVVTGFSAGIDSFSVLADHHYADVPATFKVTHLLFNNVGSHGRGDRGNLLFRKRLVRATETSARIGLPLIPVDSNLTSFYPPGLDFLLTHPPRNASVPLLLQAGVKRFLYASAVGYADANARVSDSLSYSDAMALPLLSTESMETRSVGSEYTRVEKTLQAAELAVSHDSLNVCTHPDIAGNCSECEKCLRTLLTLDVAGLLERYSSVFDLASYHRLRNRFIAEVLAGDDMLHREIAMFARQRGYAFPLTARLSAKSPVLAANLADTMLKAKRKLRRDAWRQWMRNTLARLTPRRG